MLDKKSKNKIKIKQGFTYLIYMKISDYAL